MRDFVLAAALLFSATTAGAADIAHGKEIHDAHCTSCHIGMTGGDGSLIYTRKDRRVTSLSALQAQVRRCDASLEFKMFDEDIDDVVAYLNQSYYKFPAK